MKMDKIQKYRYLKELKQLKREKLLRQARDDFFSYCQLIVPDFYKSDREYLVRLCHEFEGFMQSDDDIMLLNVPPRHGKSLTAGRFVEWELGKNPKLRVATGSYNEDMATDFSKEVRDTIVEERVIDDQIVFRDIFPDAKLKYGSTAAKRWALQGAKLSYLATSPGGSATGKGFDLLIIDDVIKGIMEAMNENELQKHWDWFTKQMLSRVEKGGKIIVIMTRWHSKDLAGRILDEMPGMGYKLRVVKMQALLDEENRQMLCSDVLSYEDFVKKRAAMGTAIANANYQQEPIDQKGRLYQSFQTYESRSQYKKIWMYCDTADTGADYLCSIVWGECQDGTAEVLDIIYTQEPMEITETSVASQVIVNQVNQGVIESNNGGRGFARVIKQKVMGKSKAAISWFHQSANKASRIYSNSAWVEQNIKFPVDWAIRWPEYYEAMTSYQREGKNAHDDAPDATTGIAETMKKRSSGISIMK
ncbi:phage terminase large subunit [Enterococcus gallinarum]|uniref:phage terminase large subunit n=1 Tax=Enterococcus gallinarum TaxID=1353 RepID=UPI0024334149|nr:phage terminase large subunit [Enterococcus gallinarum]